MRHLYQVHQIALPRHDYTYDTLVEPSATDCEIGSVLVSVRLPLLSRDVRFRSCLDIKVRAIR